jgi:hypothetical protein
MEWWPEGRGGRVGSSTEKGERGGQGQAQEAIRGWGWGCLGATQGSGLDVHNLQLCRFAATLNGNSGLVGFSAWQT